MSRWSHFAPADVSCVSCESGPVVGLAGPAGTPDLWFSAPAPEGTGRAPLHLALAAEAGVLHQAKEWPEAVHHGAPPEAVGTTPHAGEHGY